MSHAETRKETALSTKTASRPSSTATTPPSEEPTERQNDQVIDPMALALSMSDSGTRLGITALCAGSLKAAPTVSKSSSR